MNMPSDLNTVAEGEADGTVGVDHCMIQPLSPCPRIEFRHLLRQTQQCVYELLGSGLCGNHGSYLSGYLVMLSLDAIIPGGQIIVSFLVFRLVKGDMGVFADCCLNHFCKHTHFIPQAFLFSFQG